MVHSISGCTRDVQVKLRSLENACHTWAERLRDVIMTRHYAKPCLPLPATCRRTKSAPAAFFNVQRPCRLINQTRYCRWPCLSGRRQSLM